MSGKTSFSDGIVFVKNFVRFSFETQIVFSVYLKWVIYHSLIDWVLFKIHLIKQTITSNRFMYNIVTILKYRPKLIRLYRVLIERNSYTLNSYHCPGFNLRQKAILYSDVTYSHPRFTRSVTASWRAGRYVFDVAIIL